MALSQDQFFEQYWPSSEYYQQVQQYRNAVIIDGNTRRNPTGGEVARVESQMRSAARGSSQFQQSWGNYEAEQKAAAAAAALEAQRLEQERILGEARLQVEEAQKAAAISGKKSLAVSSQIRSQAQIQQTQLEQAQRQTIQTAQAQQRKTAGATVGQPGRSRTKVSSGLGIGGYGGTAAGRITSTGLNI